MVNGEEISTLSDLQAFFWVFVGVMVSVVVPIAVRLIRETVPVTRTESFSSNLWNFTKPYLAIALASSVVGLLVLIISVNNGVKFNNWAEASMAGYLWDSTFQKIKQGLID